MKEIVFLFIALRTCVLVYGQEPPRIIPPAPEATSVFKFSEVPVSTYTGLPNIIIPIHEIKCKQLTIPINLSYHARGIRVDEMAPRVGLGWSLNYGGMMSRQIRDKADDEALGYLRQNYYNSVFTPDSTNPSGFNNDLLNMYNNYVMNGLDMVPDQFMYNAGNTNGKFIFNQVTKGILLQEYKDIKIEKTEDVDGKIVGWIVTDESGNKFYFGKSKNGNVEARDFDELIDSFTYSMIDNALTDLGNGGDTRSISTWHLLEIETPFNETITFSYEDEESDYYRHSYDANSGSDVISHFSHIRSHQWQLSEITFPGGKIVFTPSTAVREDLTGAHVLDKISIYHSNSFEPAFVKEYQLSYSYTTSPANGDQLAYLKLADPKSSKRLFLTSIQEKGKSAEVIPPYTFEYNPVLLPNRFSTSQDVWGYYNGAHNREYLTFFNYGTHNIDRTVNPALSMAGILTKMIYPTGGSVEFTYEQNVAARPAIMDNIVHSTLIKTETGQVLDGFLKHAQYQVGTGAYEKQIVIGPTKTGDIEFEMDLPFCPDPIVQDECIYTVRLKNNSTGQKTALYPRPNGERTWIFSVAPGTYTLEVSTNNGQEGSLFNVTLSWTETVEDTSYAAGVVPAAGKRIKKIEHKKDGNTTLVKEYTYVTPSGGTSGKLFGLPGFYYKQNGLITSPIGCVPGSPLTTYQGNSVGYSYVTEYYGTQSGNTGKTEYMFLTTPDAGKYYEFPYHAPIDNEWIRGKNIATKTYRRNNSNTYDLVKTIDSEYLNSGGFYVNDFIHVDSTSSNDQYSVSRQKFVVSLLVFTTSEETELPSYKKYYQTGGTTHLSTIWERMYEQNEVKFENVTNYYYDYDKHYQTRGVEHVASDSTRTISVMTYFQDYDSGTPFIDAMKSKNLASYPIEEVRYQEKNGSTYILSGKLSKYNNTNPAKIDEVLTLDSDRPILLSTFRFSHRQIGEQPLSGVSSAFTPYAGYESRLTYNQYDAKGNVLQYTINDNLTVCYLWGYHHTLPIAEIKNVTYDQLVTVLGQAAIDELNNIPVTDARVRLLLEPLYSHPSLKDAQVAIYTYDPLTGVTSITDINGATNYYRYDNLGRLKAIDDKDGNRLKAIEYKYKAEN